VGSGELSATRTLIPFGAKFALCPSGSDSLTSLRLYHLGTIEIASNEGISLNQFITLAVAEKPCG
jgi:hypothetical protein